MAVRSGECEGCGREFPMSRSDKRFCSSRCRSAAFNRRTGRSRTVRAAPAVEAHDDSSVGETPPAGVVEVTRTLLRDRQMLTTPLGVTALRIATALESPILSGTEIASLSREFRTIITTIDSAATSSDDMLDELRAKRARRAGGA